MVFSAAGAWDVVQNSSEDGHDLGFHSKLEIIKKGGSSTVVILDILASYTFIYHSEKCEKYSKWL